MLPALPCLCDRSEGPSIIPGCTFEASDLKLPFFCPLAHIVDLPLCVFYGAAELHPYGPEVMPLDIYDGTWFDTWAAESRVGTDAESGEQR